jgi:hypothetical protein
VTSGVAEKGKIDVCRQLESGDRKSVEKGDRGVCMCERARVSYRHTYSCTYMYIYAHIPICLFLNFLVYTL